MLIFFEDYHHDGDDRVVEATQEEWDRLIAPAIRFRYPIDAGTVDEDLFQELYSRPAIDLKLSEVNAIEHVIPLV